MFVKTNLQFILAVIIHKDGWDSSPHAHTCTKKEFSSPKGEENVSLDFIENNCFKKIF